MPMVIENNVDSTNGQIKYSAGIGGANYTGRGVVATISFKVLDIGETKTSFVFTQGATTNTSAVAAASGPTNLLSTVNEGNYTLNEAGVTGGGNEEMPATGVLENTIMIIVGGILFLGASAFLAFKSAVK